jgi:hypothetical protein
MEAKPPQTPKPDRYEIATEVLSSAVRILFAVGFSEGDVPRLFEQVAKRPARGPLWIEPLEVKRGLTKRSAT